MISQHFLSPDIYGFIADIAGLEVILLKRNRKNLGVD
jgi:hypothetical protein